MSNSELPNNDILNNTKNTLKGVVQDLQPYAGATNPIGWIITLIDVLIALVDNLIGDNDNN